MELKVWVEGIQRIVCGVSEKTTCQEVVYALAHATGKTGRFTLIERWRNSERLLAPTEHPLKVLLKWGEHSGDVQFILQWSPLKDKPHQPSPNQPSQHHQGRAPPRLTSPPPYREPPSPAKSPALPPYRPPPPPPASPRYEEPKRPNEEWREDGSSSSLASGPSDLAQFRDILRLVNAQRSRLNSQEAELTQFDAEILFWEGKSREASRAAESVSADLARLEALANEHTDDSRGEDLATAIAHLEAEREAVRVEESRLTSALAAVKADLSATERQLAMSKTRMRTLNADLERRRCEEEDVEKEVELEVSRLRRELEVMKKDGGAWEGALGSLESDVAALDSALNEKKRLMDRLVNAMKEANLESLAVHPQEDLLEVTHQRSGSTRRMIGSPRQLETAAPTSKNPHGVWV